MAKLCGDPGINPTTLRRELTKTDIRFADPADRQPSETCSSRGFSLSMKTAKPTSRTSAGGQANPSAPVPPTGRRLEFDESLLLTTEDSEPPPARCRGQPARGRPELRCRGVNRARLRTMP